MNICKSCKRETIHVDLSCLRELQVFCTDCLYNTLKLFHASCDPATMSFEDHLVWEKWSKVFNGDNNG